MNNKSNPTPAQIQIAIDVIERLGDRVDAEAAHSVIQLPLSQLGDQYVHEIESRSFEQFKQIEAVVGQLKSWQEELSRKAGPNGARSWSVLSSLSSLMVHCSHAGLRLKNFAAAKLRPQKKLGKVILLFKRPENFSAKLFKTPAH